ncbi:MAG: FHA domain-containing protein [Ignavibacteria bacterium]|nr:FHA domain-containing protein [Ignavibacteria bacterium]
MLRDKDISNFQKIKLYLNILNNKGEAVQNLDSSKFSIRENISGKKVSPNVKKFMDSEESISLCFLIDASNSMIGAPLNNIKEGLLKILPDLRPSDKMGIAYFNDEFKKMTDFSSDKDILKNNIGELKTGGSSSQIYPSIQQAIEWLTKQNTSRKILVVLSDGEDNSNMQIEEVFNIIKDKPISVFSVGTVAESNESKGFLRNMENIASKSKDGFYYRIYSPNDMKNIIPAVYERVKNEYILTYYSYCPVSTQIKAGIEVSHGNKIFLREFDYKSPDTIKENAPALSFFETKEFLWGSIGTGIVLLALGIFLVINVKKKKQFKLEKEEEQRLRMLEAEENRMRFEEFQREYDNLLDNLENQNSISQKDKEKIIMLEQMMQETSKTAFGAPAKIDTRRRTMVLEGKSEIPEIQNFAGQPSLYIQTGILAGKVVSVSNNFIIGRQEGDLVLKDDTVSRRHASIMNNGGNYLLQDLGSTNGTFVNNKRISQAALSNGDRIRFGNVEVIFKF